MRDKFVLISLVLIVLVGGLLRFYKLDWGQGFFFHPDEYHIAIAVSKLSFPNQMNPHFFNYGTVVIYLIYFTQQLLSWFYSIVPNLTLTPNSYPLFLIGRFYSALFSTLSIIFIYKITTLTASKRWGLLAALLVTFTPGLIQQAHFATPESLMIFFILAVTYFSLKFTLNPSLKYIIFAGISMGFALGTKVSSLPIAIAPLLSIFLTLPRQIKTIPSRIILLTAAVFLIFFITAPFVFLDFSRFYQSLAYESSLAKGDLMVFYTRQFIDTTPALFQLEKIYPYALGPGLLFMGFLGFFLMAYSLFKKYSTLNILLIVSFLSLFLPNAFLFAKWTRFLSPTFPFLAIFTAFALFTISTTLSKKMAIILTSLTVFVTVIWGLSFFTIYLKDDIRVAASDWLKNQTPSNSSYLVEGGNMVDIPLKPWGKKTSIDFYDLEDNPKIQAELSSALEKSDYILIQSRRVFANHQRLAKQFPQTARFYSALFSGELGFTQIQEFNSYPEIALPSIKWQIMDEDAEETWSVFDHPVIRVFKKI